MVLLSNTCFLVGSTSRTMEPPAAGHQVKDHLRNLKECKSMDPDEMRLCVLRELVDKVAKPLSIICEKMWQSSEDPTSWKRKIRKMQSNSPL